MTPRPVRRRQAGFTLLEVLIAFAIASLALAVLVRGASEALTATRIAGQTQEAVMRARSRLAAITRDTVTPGVRSGDDGGGFRWRTEIAPVASGKDVLNPEVRETLYSVRVTIGWGSRTVVLQTERLASAR